MIRPLDPSRILRALTAVTALGSIGAILMAASAGQADAPAEPKVRQEQAPKFRRLTEAQYRATIADIFGPDIKVSGRFEPDMRVGGLLAAGTSAVSLTPAGAEQYEQIARGIAEQVVDASHRDKLIGCSPQPSDPQGAACAESFFKRLVAAALLPSVERARFFLAEMLREERSLAGM